MKAEVTETGLWYNNNRKISWRRLCRSSTLTRDYKNKIELELIPEKSEISVEGSEKNISRI